MVSVETYSYNACVLALFDPNMETNVEADAPTVGLGAVMMQFHKPEWKPVAYTLRVLRDTEARYSQIQKETLSVTYGCKTFHNFIYGDL